MSLQVELEQAPNRPSLDLLGGIRQLEGGEVMGELAIVVSLRVLRLILTT